MNHVIIFLTSLFLHLSAPVSATAPHPTPVAEREPATPAIDSLQLAAAVRTAYLVDVLQLRNAQARQLQHHTYAALQALDSLHYATPVTWVTISRRAAAAGIATHYHQALSRTLSTGQYETLLSLEKAGAPLVLAVVQ